jgi:hypothetical protein
VEAGGFYLSVRVAPETAKTEKRVMAEDVEAQAQDQELAAESPAEAQNTDERPPETWDQVFEHPRFKKLLERAKTAESQIAEFEKARKAAEEESLTEQQRWQELAEKREQELAEAQRQVEEITISAMRTRIAAKMGLPEALAERLRGDTEDEITADAKALQKLIPNNGGLPETPKPQDQGIPEEERRRRAWRPSL